jgi:hypothetical protein
VSLRTRVEEVERAALTVARVGMGLTVGEGEVMGRARVSWQVRRGAIPQVAFDATGVGADLEVSGPAVSSWERSGDRVTVQLNALEDAGVALDVSWSTGLSRADSAVVSLPQIRPDAFRTESSLQLARDGELEVVPELGGWTPVGADELPAWGQDLVLGAATASYSAGGSPGGSLSLLRFTPVAAPAVVVDVAAVVGAVAEDGHVLMRAQYQVRNERAAHMRVTAPPGLRLLGARVSGQSIAPATDGDVWLVPLARSVETVEGLLSFPVEVVLVGDLPDWERRHDGVVPLPRVDAPVAVQRVTLHLPAGYQNLLDVGEKGRVSDFSEGDSITYGFAVGDEAKAAEADALFQQAVDAWMGNEFEEVSGYLDELEGIGAGNENIDRLRSNLAVLDEDEESDDGQNVALTRRVKEQAKARSLEDQRARDDALREAEEAELAGDYEAASSNYEVAWSLGEKLGKLEQKESSSVAKKKQESVSAKLDNARVNKKKADKEREKNVQVVQAQNQPEQDQRADIDLKVLDPVADPNVVIATTGETISLETITIDDKSRDFEAQVIVGNGEYTLTPDVAAQAGGGGQVVTEVGVLGGVLDTSVMLPSGGEDVSGSFGDNGVFYDMPIEEEPMAEPMMVPEPVTGTASGSVVSAEYRVEAMPTRRRRGPRVRLPSVGGAKKAPASPAPPPPPAKPSPKPVAKGKSKPGKDAKPKESAARNDEFDFDADGVLDSMDAPPTDAVMHGGDTYAFEALQVTATALSVVVPALGETVLYQHVLLPADAESSVTVRAKTSRRTQ